MAEIQGITQNSYQFLDSLNEKGTVYLVRQPLTGRMLVGRQLTEAQAQLYQRIQQNNVPCTPTIRSITKDADNLYLETEDYIQGVSLDKWLSAHGTLPEGTAVHVILQLCDALEKLHTLGIIHRDIKPANVIVTDNFDAYLVDFDISRIEKDGQPQDTQLLGTKGYAAPEQFGFKQTDCRADIYSLGVLLHQMITGKFPGEGTVSPKIAAIIDTCINMDPAARYATVTDLATALGRKARHQRTAYVPSPEKKSIFRRIPGFRSGNLILEAIALVCYCFAALAVAVSLANAFVSLDNFFMVTVIFAFFFGTYFFIFDCFRLRTRCKSVEKHRQDKWYVLYCGAAILIWFVICFMALIIYAAIMYPPTIPVTQVQQTSSVARGTR